VSKVLFSIITFVYNSLNTIEDTILSVINQNFQNYEYIIIDGGSTDGSFEIVEKYQNKIDFVISEPDIGIYDAMYKGSDLARGKYLLFLNSVDYLTNIFANSVKEGIIDNLVDRYNLNPGMIVIDVEGAEDLVIQGALNTIQKSHPVIISELDDVLLKKLNSNSNKVICFLESLGYEVKDVNSDKINFPFSGNIIAKLNESIIINLIEI
jgi:glycosyltransferase involved in cell wall biosynthesis